MVVPERLLVFLLLLNLSVSFLPRTCFSQAYPFRHYSTADGLVQASVKRIFQDSRGFLWFGTYGGVSRYDSYEFKSYLSSGADLSIIYQIWEDPDGTLWFTTHGNGIAKLRRGDSSFVWLREKDGALPSDFVPALLFDRKERLWIGTLKGLMLIAPDGTKQLYDAASGLPSNAVRSLAEDRSGGIWVGTDGGLVRCELKTGGRMAVKKIIDAATLALIALKNGDVLAGTFGMGDVHRGFIYRYRHGRGDTLISYSSTGDVVKGLSFCEDRSGAVWIGTSYGIHVLEGDRLTRLRTENGLHNEYIYDILEDREGTMWFATEDGVLKLPRTRFVNYHQAQGLSSFIITAMLEDAKGNRWFGTFNGLTKVGPDNRLATYGEPEGLPHRAISSLLEDAQERIWVGTPRGAALFDKGRLRSPTVEGLDRNMRVASLARGSKGEIWVGGRGTLSEVVGGKVHRSWTQKDGLPPYDLTVLLHAHDGTIWFGSSSNGAGFVRRGRVTRVMKSDGLPDDVIETIYEDRRGTIWVSTPRGVVTWNGKAWSAFRFPDPASGYAITGMILEDSSGQFWFGTDHGIYVWTGERTYHFDSHDGLAGDVVKFGFVDSKGNLWFGTHNGVSKLLRAESLGSVPTPSVYLDNVTVGESDQSMVDAQVPFDDRNIVFKFNALSFVDESNLQFQWRLDGFEQDWFSPQKQRQARYTNLSPGRYSFSVRSANRNGLWSEPQRFSFEVLPPFWQTWWFALLSMVTFGSVGTVVYRYRVGQLLKVERMRTRIATDLHDDIGASLTRIVLFSEVAKEEAQKTSPRLYEVSQKIGDNARELLDAVGTLVWSIDPRHDKFEDVVTQMKNFAQEMFTMQNIDYHLTIPPDVALVELPLDVRKNLLLVFKEAVSNVVKHSGCRIASVDLLRENSVLELRISDDGKGIPRSPRSEGHGLTNMKTRAGAMRAEFSIESENGKGTVVRLRVPLGGKA